MTFVARGWSGCVWFVLAIGVAAGCGRAKPVPPAPPPPLVTVVQPVEYPVQKFQYYNGYFDAIESVEIRARVKGILTEIKFKEGEEVRGPRPEEGFEGTPLYAIDRREYETAVARAQAELERAKGEILNWKAQIKLAEAELERLKRAMGATSQTELDRAQATLEIDQAQLAVAEAEKDAAEAALRTARIQLGYTDIRAPIDGRINRTLVTRGNLVGQIEPTLLTTIVSVDELFVYFDAPERDLITYLREASRRQLPDPTSGQLEFAVGVETEVGYPHPGYIDFRENRVDPGTGTVRIRGRVKNPPVPPYNKRLLYPGLYARVRVPAGPAEKQLVLPEEALQSGQEGRFVYVVAPDGTVAKRVVTVGETVWRSPPAEATSAARWTVLNPRSEAIAAAGAGAGSGPGDGAHPPPSSFPLLAVVAIEKGLHPAEHVIINGVQRVRPGMKAQAELWEFKPPPGPGSKAAPRGSSG